MKDNENQKVLLRGSVFKRGSAVVLVPWSTVKCIYLAATVKVDCSFHYIVNGFNSDKYSTLRYISVNFCTALKNSMPAWLFSNEII